MGSQLNDWDRALIEKHLPAYKNLEARIREPSSPDERHFVAVFVNGNQPIKTQHEIAYSRYKQLEEQRSKNDQNGRRCDALGEALRLIDLKPVEKNNEIIFLAAPR